MSEEKRDWLQYRRLPNQPLIEYSQSGIRKLLDNKPTPLTPAELILQEVLSQSPVEAQAGLQEIMEFSRTFRVIEPEKKLAALQMEQLDDETRNFIKVIPLAYYFLNGTDEAVYEAGKKRIEEWMESNNQHLKDWFSNQDNIAKPTAVQKYSRRRFLDSAIGGGSLLAAAPYFLYHLDGMRFTGVNIADIARITLSGATIGAGYILANVTEEEKEQIVQGRSALKVLEDNLRLLDEYILRSMLEKHPELFADRSTGITR